MVGNAVLSLGPGGDNTPTRGKTEEEIIDKDAGYFKIKLAITNSLMPGMADHEPKLGIPTIFFQVSRFI